jgi:hypothetical protein
MTPEDRAKAEEVARAIASSFLNEDCYFGHCGYEVPEEKLEARITAAILPLWEQNRELVETLKPFAEQTRFHPAPNWKDDDHVMTNLRVIDFRRAAALLSRLQPDKS